MNVIIDHKTSNKSYGYTKENNGTVWYWNFDGEKLEFRDYGYPTNHPYNNKGYVPNNIKKVTKHYLDI